MPVINRFKIKEIWFGFYSAGFAMCNGALDTTSTKKTATINDQIRVLKGNELGVGSRRSNLWYLFFPYLEPRRKWHIIVFHCFLFAPIIVFTGEVDQPFLSIGDPINCGKTFMTAFCITLSTVLAASGQILRIDRLQIPSQLVICHACHCYCSWLPPPLLMRE